MTLEEFNILYAIHKNNNTLNKTLLSEETNYDTGQLDKMIEILKNKRWLSDSITALGYKALNEYKVDNAIIMAAGFGLRSLPLSRVIPKGLYRVCGEVLIERQIRQLQDAGIKEIVIVVGFLKEKFDYLAEKYGAIIINNDDYYRYNNISSLYAAKHFLKNSFICCSDNYFNKNVFEEYVYDSYYSCKYTEGYADEHCVTKVNGDYIEEIHKGGSHAWYTIGEAYFSKQFSRTFLGYLELEYESQDTRKLIWDDFHIKHIDALPLRLVKYSDEIVQEFDTIEDVVAFDPSFVDFIDEVLSEASRTNQCVPKILEKYDDVERYNSAVTDQRDGRLHLNENSFGPSPRCLDVLKEITMPDLYEYDMASKDFLVEEISKRYSMPEDDIYIHNGSAEIIKSLFSIALEKGDSVLISRPDWSYYASLARENFCEVFYYDILKDDYEYYVDAKDLLEKAKKYHPKLIVIASPNNPTGCRIDEKALEIIVKQNTDSLILLDEAYEGFIEEDIDIRRLVEAYSNIIISRTFSKFYGLANMRIGYGFCNFKIRRILGLDLPLFRANPISRKMAAVALHDHDYYKNMSMELINCKQWFIDELNKISGIRAFRSCCNFVPVQITGINMRELQVYMKENDILIRLFSDRDEVMARITIADKKTMEKVVQLIQKFVIGKRYE